MVEKLMSSALLKVSHAEDVYNDRSAIVLDLEGSHEIRFMEGEPEDATLNRDYSDVYQIAEMIEYANQMGLDGVKVLVDEVDIDWNEI